MPSPFSACAVLLLASGSIPAGGGGDSVVVGEMGTRNVGVRRECSVRSVGSLHVSAFLVGTRLGCLVHTNMPASGALVCTRLLTTLLRCFVSGVNSNRND